MSELNNACMIIEKSETSSLELENVGIYPGSLNKVDDSVIFMMKTSEGKKLIIYNCTEDFIGKETIINNKSVKVCDLTHENCQTIRKIFSFTNPEPVLKYVRTIGLGDRLGLASAGHIRLIEQYDIKPILAQQSIRELNLTGRDYKGVLDDACWAVFQEGYRKGFGADGDHLKTKEEVKMAIDCGFTMITLDCSEHIDNSINNMSDEEVTTIYNKADHKYLEDKYLHKVFEIQNGFSIKFDDNEFKRIVLIYGSAIEFAVTIYHENIKDRSGEIDFEISIDETLTSTSPQAHYFVAKQLLDAGVDIATLAPRFCGEFQKGIDYIGDITAFEEEFKVHSAIAETFDYKISVHSGSDKFSVFPIIGEITNSRFHVKTAGTNWLEAVRVIAAKDPDLYREIHRFAIENLDEAKKYYHIGAKLSNIQDIKDLSDEELPNLMDLNDSRQVIHITYGLILKAKDKEGKNLFRDRIYKVLYENETVYYEYLYKHIKRHLSGLGL